MRVFPNHYTDHVHIHLCDLTSRSTTIWLRCGTVLTIPECFMPLIHGLFRYFICDVAFRSSSDIYFNIFPCCTKKQITAHCSTLISSISASSILAKFQTRKFGEKLMLQLCHTVCETEYFCIHLCWGPRTLYSWLDKTTSYSTRYGMVIKIWYQKNVELIYHKR